MVGYLLSELIKVNSVTEFNIHCFKIHIYYQIMDIELCRFCCDKNLTVLFIRTVLLQYKSVIGVYLLIIK